MFRHNAAPDLSGLRVEVAGDIASLRQLAPAWRELVAVSGVDHPFTTPEWIESWWEAFGGGPRKLFVLSAWRGRSCVGVAPLALRRGRLYGIPVRRCESIGNTHTPRWDVLVAPGEEEAYGALWRFLVQNSALWDVLLLAQLPAESRTLDLWPKLAEQGGMLSGRWTAGGSPRVPIRGDWESYVATLPRKHRSNLRNRSRRLAKLGEVTSKILLGPEGIAEPLAEAWRIEALGWKGAQGTAVACSPASKRLYESFAERAAGRGWLQLRFLEVAGKRVAFMYNLRFGAFDFIVKQGFDPELGAYAPSTHLAQLVLEEAFSGGLDAVDFLGDDDDFKLRWNSEVRRHYWLFLFPDRLRTRVIHAAKFRVLPTLRSWVSTARPASPETPSED
jgi:CelD/BcsL family acetyltransferase involved in cellulose biosynthesis